MKHEVKYIGTFEVKDGKKVVNIPFAHKPVDYCGCINCKLMRGEMSVDMYKGIILGEYILGKYLHKHINEDVLKLFFTDDELADFIMNS